MTGLVVWTVLVFAAGVIAGWGYAKADAPDIEWSPDRKALHELGRRRL